MITFSHCGLTYQQDGKNVPVYQDFNLQIAERESLVLIGPSGCGKSTLLYLLAGLLKPTEGEVRIHDQLVDKPRQQTGFILQEYGLFPWLTVRDNISLGLRVRHQSRHLYQAKVDHMIEQMGLQKVRTHYPSQLSGGQRQRVALARALTLDPDLLLMDEPLSSLDALTRERLQQLLLELWQERSLTTVLVTHNIEEAVFLGSRILVFQGPPAQLKGIVLNPEIGSSEYRMSDLFFRRCTEVRSLLEGRGGT